MPLCTLRSNRWLFGVMSCALAIGTSQAYAGAATGNATEFTQLANNAQLNLTMNHNDLVCQCETDSQNPIYFCQCLLHESLLQCRTDVHRKRP